MKYHNPKTDTVIDVKKHASPIALLCGVAKKETIFLAAGICIGYSKAPKLSPVDVVVKNPDGTEKIEAIGIFPDDVKKLMI